MQLYLSEWKNRDYPIYLLLFRISGNIIFNITCWRSYLNVQLETEFPVCSDLRDQHTIEESVPAEPPKHAQEPFSVKNCWPFDIEFSLLNTSSRVLSIPK